MLMNLWFSQKYKGFWAAEEQIASGEGDCSMKLFG
jgi:hypothetical protein